ncbi:MAG TPA: SpoIIE family protein phosphatase [Phycisphaerae bacterium]|nr:SpoIIE family protein phosphatase [Phycisphaerae bacterium]
MCAAEFCADHLLSTLSGQSLHRSLGVFAEATATTVILFNQNNEIVVGPITGSSFMRQLIETPVGRQFVENAHRQAAAAENALPARRLLDRGYLGRFAVPVIRTGARVGTLTLGDRPRQPLPDSVVAEMAAATGLDRDALLQAVRELPCWTAAQAEAIRNLGAVLVELFASLCAQDEDLRRRIEELSVVYNIAGLFAGSLDLKEILDKTARMVCEVMKTKACSIRMLDEASGSLSIKAVHNLSWEYLDKGPVSVDENPIDQAAIHGELVRIADMPNDPRVRYPEQARKEGIVSGLVCGMIYRGKAVGVIRVYTGEPHTFTPYEESLLQAVASQAAAAIVNARLLAEAIEAERYARQIAYAGDVQRRMIPRKAPDCKQVEIGALYRPTYRVGGDFYDLIQLPQDNLGVGIADVSGKGVPASLLMASLRSALRVYAYVTYDVDVIMAEVNRHMCRDTTIGEFTTAFYGVITPDGRRLTYCNAGHDPPMHLRDGKITYLETGGMVLGVDYTATFERGIVELQSGDIILLYTDGVVEALNFADESYGRQRLAESLLRYADQPAERIVQNLNWDLRRFRGLADRLDDVTLVVLKIR